MVALRKRMLKSLKKRLSKRGKSETDIGATRDVAEVTDQGATSTDPVPETDAAVAEVPNLVQRLSGILADAAEKCVGARCLSKSASGEAAASKEEAAAEEEVVLAEAKPAGTPGGRLSEEELEAARLQWRDYGLRSFDMALAKEMSVTRAEYDEVDEVAAAYAHATAEAAAAEPTLFDTLKKSVSSYLGRDTPPVEETPVA